MSWTKSFIDQTDLKNKQTENVVSYTDHTDKITNCV